MGNKEIFDRMADQYETDDRIADANVCIDMIKHYIDYKRTKSAMDFGCGTGLVGLGLADLFDSMLLVDAAPNMVQYAQKKIDDLKLENTRTRCVDLENEQNLLERVDYIMAVQVLLHIKDTRSILTKLYSLLNDNGHLILIDFDKNPMVESELVHNGFDQKSLADVLKEIGFNQTKYETFYQRDHMFMNQEASLFIMDAQR